MQLDPTEEDLGHLNGVDPELGPRLPRRRLVLAFQVVLVGHDAVVNVHLGQLRGQIVLVSVHVFNWKLLKLSSEEGFGADFLCRGRQVLADPLVLLPVEPLVLLRAVEDGGATGAPLQGAALRTGLPTYL